MSDPLAVLMLRLARAMREYDPTLTPEEASLLATCPCGLCDGMRKIRAAIVDYETEADRPPEDEE